MNTTDMARASYGEPTGTVRSLRSIEYDLFARNTHRLSAATSRPTNDPGGLELALHDNARMWRTLAADVAESANGLPAPLRAQLFYLYEFTVQHSRKVLAAGASVDVLVDINTAVMRGLRGNGGTA